MIKKLAILTSGGDAPGMNNAIWAITKEARQAGIEPYLVYGGYKGLYEGDIRPAAETKVERYISKGGTFIYSSRFPEFKDLEVRKIAKQQLDKKGIEALVVIGGDGSYKGAQLLHELGVKTVALPGTIDNDISSSDFTIGYDTALNTIVENVDRIRDTMRSHRRAAIVEVMGHGAGDLCAFGGLAAAAEIIVTNECIMSPEEIASKVKKQFESGRRSVIIMVSEFIFPDLKELQNKITELSGIVTRAISLKHVQRGGVPTAMERINSSMMGIYAVDQIINNKSGIAIGILSGKVVDTPIMEALATKNKGVKEWAEKFNRLHDFSEGMK